LKRSECLKYQTKRPYRKKTKEGLEKTVMKENGAPGKKNCCTQTGLQGKNGDLPINRKKTLMKHKKKKRDKKLEATYQGKILGGKGMENKAYWFTLKIGGLSRNAMWGGTG